MSADVIRNSGRSIVTKVLPLGTVGYLFLLLGVARCPRFASRFWTLTWDRFALISDWYTVPPCLVVCLEETRRVFGMRVYGYVVMPEHVHLLISEPDERKLADAIHRLKLSFAKRVKKISATSPNGAFWQKRYYDRNVKDHREFTVKLRYLHRNPVKRGLVTNPQDWQWSSFRHYALREVGIVEIESQWTATDREQDSTEVPGRIFLRPG